MHESIIIQAPDTQRIPLMRGQELLTRFRDAEGRICSCRIQVTDIIGKGASCICYTVRAQFEVGIWRSCIMKEFYPEPQVGSISIRRDTGTGQLQMAGPMDVLKALRRRFYESSYRLQNELANFPDLTDYVVAPTLRLEGPPESPWNICLLYEMNTGTVPGSDFPGNRDAESILLFACKLAQSLRSLHARHYLHLDIKPSNLLWTEQEDPGNARVMFFDFDSAVNLEEIQHLSMDSLRITPELAAPELINCACFEQDKAFLLKPRLDLYSVGCTLFWVLLHRYPNERDLPEKPTDPCRWEAELRELCNIGNLRGQIPAAAQEDLCGVLKKCLSVQPRKRYASADALHRDLSAILKTIQLNIDRPAAVQDVNYEIPAAHLLFENPLCEYAHQGELRVGLVGSSPMRDELLKKLLSCVQMKDVQTVIHIWDSDAKGYLQALCCLWPELANAVELTVDRMPLPGNPEKKLFDKPLAKIHFHSREEAKDPDLSPCSVVFLSEKDGQENYAMAQRLEAQWPLGKKGLICYADTRGDGYSLRTLATEKEALRLVPFGMNRFYSGGELSLQSQLLRMSFEVHRHYSGNPENPKAIDQMWKEFCADRYSIRSGNRFALTVPYKLAGIHCASENPAVEFARILTDPEAAASLQWLEHRSWAAFMITEGYRRPSWQEVSRYAYAGQNDQRDKLRKLHPCLCDSRISQLPLQALPKEHWLTAELTDFDPLDQVSLQLHRICCRLTQKAQNEMSLYLELLREELLREAEPVSFEILLNALSNAAQGLFNGDPAADQQWNQSLIQISQWWKERQSPNSTVQELLTLIKRCMLPVRDRNQYIDYKKYDLDVLRAIPDLLRVQQADAR